jgi:hypothetical protein
MARVSIGMELIDGNKFLKQLEQLESVIRSTVIENAIQAGTVPVEAAMLANTPESDGSRRQQSTKTKRRWSGAKKLKTTIRSVVRPKKKLGVLIGRIGLVGPSYSEGGGHGNLFSKDHKRKVLWGRDAGTIRKVNQFVKKTADETKSAASAAVTSSLKSGIEAAVNRMAK